MVKLSSCTAFDGETFDHKSDGKRLKRQLNDVFELMKDGQWRTLQQISEITSHPPQSISARLRDLRKPKFGNYAVNRRRRGHWSEGIYEYQVLKFFKNQNGCDYYDQEID